MRRTVSNLAVLLVVLGSPANAQMALNDDRLMSYVGYLEDGIGPVSDVVDVRVALFPSASAAAGANDCLRDSFASCGLWREEIPGVTVSGGRFSVLLGQTSSLLDADLASDGLWVGVGVKGSLDAEWAPLAGRQRLIPVPLASRAAAARDYKITGTARLQGAVRITDTTDVDINNNGGAFVVGSDAENIGIDGNEIMARSASDVLFLQTQGGHVEIGSSAHVNQWLRLRCATCGNSAALVSNGADWGTLTLQGRVVSSSSNLHLSPPSGAGVIIDDTYRAAGGTANGVPPYLQVEGNILAGGDVRVGGTLRVRVDATTRASGGDSNPEVYKLNDNQGCTRGDIWVGRPSGETTQDGLCACLDLGGNLEAWCFNP